MKRIISSVLLLVLVLALAVTGASCKSSEKPSTGNGKVDESIPGGIAGVSPQVLEALSDTGKVTVYYLNGELTDYDKDFSKYFSDVYGGKLDAVVTPWEGWQDKFYQDFMSNSGPDLFYLFEKNWPKAATRNLAYSVEELQAGVSFDHDGKKGKAPVLGLDHAMLSDKLDTVQSFFQMSGKKYVFADYMTEPVIMMVNEDIFARYEVESPYELYKQGKWNYDTFIDAARKTTKDTNDDSITDVWGYQGWDWNYVITAAGGELVKIENGKIVNGFDDAKTMKGFQHLRDIYGTYRVSIWNTINASNFVNGEIAMCAMLPNNFATTKDSNRNIADATFKWSCVPYPLDSGNTSGMRSGNCYAWAVSTGAKNPQGAVNYVIALNCYEDIHPRGWNGKDYSVYTDEMKQMFEDNSQHVVLPIFQGVGSLLNIQWTLRDNISGGTTEITEVLEAERGRWDGQIQLENEGGES